MAKMYNAQPCEYTSVSTAAGAGVVIATGPGYFYGLSVFAKTTGATNIAIYDATATATGTFIAMARTSGTGVGYTVMMAGPVICKTGIYASMVAGTAASDFGTVLFTKA